MAFPRQKKYTPDPNEQLFETALQEFFNGQFAKVISSTRVFFFQKVLNQKNAAETSNKTTSSKIEYSIILLYFAAALSQKKDAEIHHSILIFLEQLINEALSLKDPSTVKKAVDCAEAQYLLARELAAKNPNDFRFAPFEEKALQILHEYPHVKDFQELESSALNAICLILYDHDRENRRPYWLKHLKEAKSAKLTLARAQFKGDMPGIPKDEKAAGVTFKQLSEAKYVPGQHAYADYLVSRRPRFPDAVYNHGLKILKELALHYGPSAFRLYELCDSTDAKDSAEATTQFVNAVGLSYWRANYAYAHYLIQRCETEAKFNENKVEIEEFLQLTVEAGVNDALSDLKWFKQLDPTKPETFPLTNKSAESAKSDLKAVAVKSSVSSAAARAANTVRKKLSASARRELEFQRELAAAESRETPQATPAQSQPVTQQNLPSPSVPTQPRQTVNFKDFIAQGKAAATQHHIKQSEHDKTAAHQAKTSQDAGAAGETALQLQAEKETAAKALQDAINVATAREREAKAPIKVRYYGNLWLVKKNQPLYFIRENKRYVLHLPQDRPSTEIIDITPQPPKIHGVVA